MKTDLIKVITGQEGTQLTRLLLSLYYQVRRTRRKLKSPKSIKSGRTSSGLRFQCRPPRNESYVQFGRSLQPSSEAEVLVDVNSQIKEKSFWIPNTTFDELSKIELEKSTLVDKKM